MSARGLAGDHIVVVGGASGIGLAVGRGALERGARVSLLDVDEAGLSRVAAEERRFSVRAVDVGDERQVEAFFADAGRLDHVFVAAGTTRLGDLFGAPLDEQLAPLVLRVWGSARVARAVARRLGAGGSLVFTGGVSTDRPVPGAWVSSVGTAAAEQLARALALELAPVRVNAVAPGWTDTPMWDRVLGSEKAAVLEAVASKLPIRRIAQPEEVAHAVLFLMENRAVTGAIVNVDGGGRLV